MKLANGAFCFDDEEEKKEFDPFNF